MGVEVVVEVLGDIWFATIENEKDCR